jgi:hypothetical protein
VPDPNAKHNARLATYAATATALSLLSDRRLGELLPQAAAMLSRCAPPALLTLDFHRALSTGSKTTPFPAAAIERSLRLGR